MEKKAKIFLITLISFITALGIVPLFLPPYISDLSHVDWNGQDISAQIIPDDNYLNDTFVNFNTPSHLYYYSVRGRSFAERTTMITLQGLVNKYNTSLFIEETENDDYFWFEKIKSYFGVTSTNLSTNKYWDVINQFKENISGLVIYDENLIDTVNVATFLASLCDGVVITYSMKENFSSLGITKVFHDLRNNFTNKVDLYTWAWDNYKHLASKKHLFNLDTNRARMRDYVIASKAFTFWLTPGPLGDLREIALFQRILNETPSNTPLWGWFPEGAMGEYEGLRSVSHAGKYVIVSSWSNPTVFSAFHIPQFQQKPVSFNASGFEIKNKIYISVIVSDGDNIRYCHGTLRKLWEDPTRGTVPLGFTLSPLLYKLNPAVIKYYYESATANEYFVCPPSGAGYTYPDMNPSIAKFLSHTKPIMDAVDMHQVWLLNGYEAFEPSFSPEVLNAYTSSVNNYSGIYLNYHDFQVNRNELVNDCPVIQSIFVEQKNEIIGKLKTIELTKQHENQPIFVYIATNSWNVQFSELNSTISALDPNIYEVLRPDQFAAVFKKHQQGIQSPLNEASIFLIAGLIPFLSILSLTALILYKKHVKERDADIIKEDVEKNVMKPITNPESRSVIPFSENSSRFTLRLIYMFSDVIFLFIMKYCLYTSNLVMVYLALFMISILMGVLLRKIIEKNLGRQGSFKFSLSCLGVGMLLFCLNFKMIMFIGIPLGLILSHQFQFFLDKKVVHSNEKQATLYSFIISMIVINLIPRELNDVFKWVLATAFIAFILFIIMKFIKSKGKKGFFSLFQGEIKVERKVSKSASFFMGFLFMLLFIPTFAQEKLYYHLIWGLEYFPSKLAIQFAVATSYIIAILLFEMIKKKDVKLTRKKRWGLFLASLTGYIVMPFILTGIIVFYIIHVAFIFGLIIMIDHGLLRLPGHVRVKEMLEKNDKNLKKEERSYQMFLSGFITWFMILVILAFTPPVTIVVDTYNLFEKLGLVGITELNWNPVFWTLFYIPSIYIMIALPITIFCVFWGIGMTILRIVG